MSSQEVFTTRKGRTLGVILSDCDFKYKVTCEWNIYEQVKTDTGQYWYWHEIRKLLKSWVTGQIKTHRPKLYTSNLIQISEQKITEVSQMRVRLDFYLHSTAPQRKGTILWYCNILHNQMTIDDLQRCLWKR